MNRSALVEALETLGEPTGADEHQLRERLLELIEPEGADPVGCEEALVEARRRLWRRCLLRFLEECWRTESDAVRVADDRLKRCKSAADFRAMWDRLVAEYCPPSPAPPDRSSSGKVLVIAPGFGFDATPEQLQKLKDAFSAAIVTSNQHANPEKFRVGEMSEKIKRILREIREHKPKVILCASKGGRYMEELWRLMEADGHDHLKDIGYLMINVRPGLTRLPLDVKVIVVQGANEEKWPRARGYDKHGKVEDGSLEALIRTGSPGMCYHYYTADVESGFGNRKGDTIRTCLPRCCSTTACRASSTHCSVRAVEALAPSFRRHRASSCLPSAWPLRMALAGIRTRFGRALSATSAPVALRCQRTARSSRMWRLSSRQIRQGELSASTSVTEAPTISTSPRSSACRIESSGTRSTIRGAV